MVAVCLGLLLPSPAPAQDRRLTVQQPPAAERRMALVIGNAAYPAMPLRNAVNDAQAVGAALRQTGFETDVATDVNFRDMTRAVESFVTKLRSGDVALVYYSGHGLQIDGENYFLPIDFDAKDEADAKYVGYSASRLHDRVSGRGVRLQIMVIDACRNNPFRISRSAASGLAQMSAGRGSFIALATGPGGVADDNSSGRNGLFTTAVLEVLQQPGLNLDQVFHSVRQKVYDASNGRQTPWANSSVIGDFFFRPESAPAVPTGGNAPSPPASSSSLASAAAEQTFWESIRDDTSPARFQEYFKRFGTAGRYSGLARSKVQELTPNGRFFWNDAALVLHFIKGDKTADFEAAMVKTREALRSSKRPEWRTMATGWTVLKAVEPAGENVLYAMVIRDPVRAGDYNVSNIVAAAFPIAEVEPVLRKLVEAHAMGMNIVNLNVLHALDDGRFPAGSRPSQGTSVAPPRTFSGQWGLVLNMIRPDAAPDFEDAMLKVKEALQGSDRPDRRRQTQGWTIFRSPDRAGDNALYVSLVSPNIRGADYDLSNIIADGFPVTEANEIRTKYARSYAQGMNILSLNVLQDFGW